VASPILAWNVANDWVMLRHERGHVTGHGAGGSPAHLAELLAGQILALSPLIAAVAVGRLRRIPGPPAQRLVWAVSVATLGFFVVKAATSKVQLNWPAPAYIGLLALFAGHIPHLGRGGRRVLAVGLGLSLALLAVAHFPAAVGIPGNRDPFAEMKAWRGPVAELAARAGPADFVLTRGYTLASELAFYWPGHLPVYLTGDSRRRMNQFDLWGGLEHQVGRTGVYVDTRSTPPALLEQAFAGCEPLEPVTARAADGGPIRTLHAWRCRDHRPIAWPRPGRY
jgi:hypothetical protein